LQGANRRRAADLIRRVLHGSSRHPPPDITVLAFDYGKRRVGVAVGNTLVRAAHPLATIDEERADARFAAIASLVSQWQPQRFVVGLPVHADGREHELTARARRFANQLEGRFRVPVSLVDERHSTDEAKARLAAAGRGGRRHRDLRDAVAAQVILQAFFDGHDGTA
jgi:putative Holliday junction resolvase